jgi:hypothetical protein
MDQDRLRYDVVVSLGANCIPYYHLVRLGRSMYHTPFDQMGTEDLDGMLRYLHDGCTGLFDVWQMSHSQPCSEMVTVEDPRYTIETPHYFTLKGPTLANYEAAMKEVRVLEWSFRALMGAGVRCLGIRTRTSPEYCVVLRHELNLLGATVFDICCISRSDVQMPTAYQAGEGVFGYSIPLRLPEDPWWGSNADWDVILGGVL